MALAEVPMLFVLGGLAAYVVLGGADFGAGFWHMASRGRQRAALRDHTYHAMGPVWEANHVWLVFVLVVMWTAYPRAFGSIASTLYVPLFLAAVGIILRGTTYALRGAARGPREERLVGTVFGLSSLLTPFALGTAIGGIASGRVPVGNAQGDALESWLNPTSLLIGVLAAAASVYLAAVWLTADAARGGRAELVRAFRVRALAAGVVAGAIAAAGLLVLRGDAERVFDGLTGGAGLAAVFVSAAAGAGTLALVARLRLEAARYLAAVAVAAIVAGFALAQQPQLLPGLTVEQAAAGEATLIVLLAGIALAALVLVPSLGLLFGLVLHGRFDARPDELGSLVAEEGAREAAPGVPASAWVPPRLVAVSTVVAALAGVALTVVAEGGVARVLGVAALLLGTALAAALAVSAVTLAEGDDA